MTNHRDDPIPLVDATRPILYLDVDGVLLGAAGRAGEGQSGLGTALARHAEEFLAYCTTQCDCYWLTTHCREGDAGPVMRYLARYAGEIALVLAAAVKPTAWCTLKTEVIDPESDFYVVDDGLLQVEQEWLAVHGVRDRWIETDTRIRPDDLKRVLGLLQEKLTPARSSWWVGLV
jgi:hypothetical protein